jgi:hypothetical protein
MKVVSAGQPSLSACIESVLGDVLLHYIRARRARALPALAQFAQIISVITKPAKHIG